MARIDFPKTGNTFVDDNGTLWKKTNNSWVKNFDYTLEAPIDNKQYARRSGEWDEIVYPIPTDVSVEVDYDVGTYYARKEDAWIEIDLGAAGPAFNKTVAGLYGLDQATGLWAILPNSDLTANYYDKTVSDARFAAAAHTHTYGDGTLSGFGSMAAQADAPSDGDNYVRVDAGWAIAPVVPKPSLVSSITIIDPIGTDDALLFWTPVETVVTQIRVAVLGSSPSAVFNIKHGLEADGSGTVGSILASAATTTSTVGEAITPSSPTIPANSYVWVDLVSDPTNTTMFHLSMVHSET